MLLPALSPIEAQGFSTASGRKVQISEKALEEARSKLSLDIIQDENKINKELTVKQGLEHCDLRSVIINNKGLNPEIKTVIPDMNTVIPDVDEEDFFCDDDDEFTNMATEVKKIITLHL